MAVPDVASDEMFFHFWGAVSGGRLERGGGLGVRVGGGCRVVSPTDGDGS